MLLGIDLGTTNIKALVTDLAGRSLGRGSASVQLLYPGPDAVEQDIEEIWTATRQAIRQALHAVDPYAIQAIGISSQGGAMQITDAQFQPLGRVISWLDGRGASFDTALSAELGEESCVRGIGHKRAGFAVGQILRLRRECPERLAPPHRIGFVGDLIVQRLCGQAGHDGTSGSLTALYDPLRRCYAAEVLRRLGVAPEQLPPLLSPRTPVGGLSSALARETGLRAGIPVSAAIHDQYTTALATGAVRAGTAMVGTGTAWVLLAVTESMFRPVASLAFSCHHVVEGLWGQIVSLGNGGSALGWVLKMIGQDHRSAAEIDALIETAPPGSDGLCCWPFLAPTAPAGLSAGLGGRLAGLRLSHSPAHVARAMLEGLACELARHLGFLRDRGVAVERLVLGGAGASSRVTPPLLAAVTGLPLACAGPDAGSPLGAAIIARGLLEPKTSLVVLAEQMAPVSRWVEAGPEAPLYQELFQRYVASLPSERPGPCPNSSPGTMPASTPSNSPTNSVHHPPQTDACSAPSPIPSPERAQPSNTSGREERACSPRTQSKQATPLHHVFDYTEVDRAFWEEHLGPWLPPRILDAHTHVMDPQFRLQPMTDAMRRQYWVNEVLEPIDGPTAERCYRTVFPNRTVSCVAFGLPDLDFDLNGANADVSRQCAARGWHSLALVQPQWSQEKVAALLDLPTVIGVKPYYALISAHRDTRDAHLESSIFEFLPHHLLEVVNERHAWVTLHVPRAARLGHPENVREVREIRRLYPNIILVIAHLGRCYTEAHAREALPQFADDPGLYFDTSAVLNPASHRVALEHLGPQRILYGSDNPVMYMRGRRQYLERAYINRTSYPFAFNTQRELPEIEAAYTLYMYEDLLAIKQACAELGLTQPQHVKRLFHDNAASLIDRIVSHRQKTAP